MALRRGRKRRRSVDEDAGTGVAAGVIGVDVPSGPVGPVRERPETGPWDVSEVEDDGVERLDLGCLRVPVSGDLAVRVDVGPRGEPLVVRVVGEGSEMQLGAFAAPRTAGIWDEIRADISASLVGQGGRASDEEGSFGVELRALVPVEGGTVPGRFIGVDGPRWFLRALIIGRAAVQSKAAEPFEDVLREVVVVRGAEARPVRDPLALVLPTPDAEVEPAEVEPAEPAPVEGEPAEERPHQS